MATSRDFSQLSDRACSKLFSRAVWDTNPRSASELADETAVVTEPPRLEFTPSTESLHLLSHYSPEVNNILWTYRTSPDFENLSGEAVNYTAFRLFFCSQSATPRNDH